MRDPDLRHQQTQIVQNLSGRSDVRSTGARWCLLCDRDRWRDSVDAFRCWFFKSLEELTGVSRKALDIATLPFRVQSVEREARFSAATHSTEHHKLVMGNVEVNLFEIVDFDAAEFDV